MTHNVMQHTQNQGKDTHNGGICTHDVHADPLTRIKNAAYEMLRHSGLDDYPYQEGVEGLKTSLVCTLNIILDLISHIEERSNEP